jgi:hypothetical protein
VYEKLVLRMPWPAKNFLFGLFPGELSAQREVLNFARMGPLVEEDIPDGTTNPI